MPGWSGSWFGDWQGAWLGVQTRTPVLTITDTDILQLPVDVVLAGQQMIFDRGREYDIRPMNRRHKKVGHTSGPRRLEGGPPSFTTTSSKKGYE